MLICDHVHQFRFSYLGQDPRVLGDRVQVHGGDGLLDVLVTHLVHRLKD